jgi:IS30 family transposase
MGVGENIAGLLECRDGITVATFTRRPSDGRARRLGSNVHFASPYRSWQRGTSENTNGLLRQFFPKRTDFTRISHHAVARAETLLNERPRKRLGYRTPAEVFAENARCD